MARRAGRHAVTPGTPRRHVGTPARPSPWPGTRAQLPAKLPRSHHRPFRIIPNGRPCLPPLHRGSRPAARRQCRRGRLPRARGGADRGSARHRARRAPVDLLLI